MVRIDDPIAAARLGKGRTLCPKLPPWTSWPFQMDLQPFITLGAAGFGQNVLASGSRPGKPVNASPRERELTRFRPVTELALPSRATNALLRNGVRSVGQLIARSKEDLMTEITGLGEGMLKIIEASLALENLSLARADEPSSRLPSYHHAALGADPRPIATSLTTRHGSGQGTTIPDLGGRSFTLGPRRSSLHTLRVSRWRRLSSAWSRPGHWVLVPLILSL